MAIKLSASHKSRDWSSIALKIVETATKAAIAAGTKSIPGDVGGLSIGIAAAGPISTGVIDLIKNNTSTKSKHLGEVAWGFLIDALTLAMNQIFQNPKFFKLDRNAANKNIIKDILTHAEVSKNGNQQEISIHHLFAPSKIIIFRDAREALVHEFSSGPQAIKPEDIRNLFDDCIKTGLRYARDIDPDRSLKIDGSLKDQFSETDDKLNALGLHEEYILKMFESSVIIGQDDTGITLKDIYVPQRCMWKEQCSRSDVSLKDQSTKTKSFEGMNNDFSTTKAEKNTIKYTKHDRIHNVVLQWLDAKKPRDAFRVVAGGPGSGKSSFAKALAANLIQGTAYRVLFIPLQKVDPEGSFEVRLANLFRVTTELGFDKVPSPLTWLGQRGPDQAAPDQPLLLIFDGLDELAAPDSFDANRVTQDFIQLMERWIIERNSADCYVKAIILGRTLAAEEAFRNLNIDEHCLLMISGLRPREYSDIDVARQILSESDILKTINILEEDDRKQFWVKWCEAKSMDASLVPEPLRAEIGKNSSVDELTDEPLLLYLLLWTDMFGARWQEVISNKNKIYLEIYHRMYKKEWGDSSATKSGRLKRKGGHPLTRNQSFEDFMLRQEAMGVAAWRSGGRVFDTENYRDALQTILDEDEFSELSKDVSSLVRSAALQAYTRGIDGQKNSFEFMHKTFAEYLIGRAINRTLSERIFQKLERSSDNRLKDSALWLVNLCRHGVLTKEINDFLSNEIKNVDPDTKSERIKRLVALIEWTLKHGQPAHLMAPSADQIHWNTLESVAQRADDVLWTYFQGIALAPQEENSQSHEATISRTDGAFQIKWPNPYSFSALVSRLTDRLYVSLTNRITTFSQIDLTQQVMTQYCFGSVIYEIKDRSKEKQGPNLLPRHWLGLDLRRTNLRQVPMHSSDLSQVDFTEANLSGAILTRATLDDAILTRASLDGAYLVAVRAQHAKFNNADLSDANLKSGDFRSADFSAAHISGIVWHHPIAIPRALPQLPANFTGAKFSESVMEGGWLEGIKLNSTVWTGAKLKNAVFVGASLKGANFADAEFHNVTFSENQLASLDKKLDQQQLKQINIIPENSVTLWLAKKRPKQLNKKQKNRHD